MKEKYGFQTALKLFMSNIIFYSPVVLFIAPGTKPRYNYYIRAAAAGPTKTIVIYNMINWTHECFLIN